MKKNLVKWPIWILLISVMLLFAGCADDNTQQNAEPDITQGETTPVTLKVGMLGADIKTACIIIAQEPGYYDEEGLNVEFENISNLSDGITAVDMGKLDVLPFGVIPSATFISQGSDVVIFGGTISEGSEIIVTAENAATIQSIEDFRGKKIGCYRMETGHMVMKGLLTEAGIDINTDVEFVLLDSQQSIIEAVRKGEVDLGFVNSGQGYIAQQSGLVVANRVSEFFADFPCCRQTTSRSAITEKRDALVKFEVANLRAYEVFINDHETAINALVAYSGQPAEYVEAIMYGIEGEYDNAMIISLDPNKNKVIDFYETMKLNGDIAPDTQYDIADYIDTSIYEDALKEMLNRNPNSELFAGLMEEFTNNNN